MDDRFLEPDVELMPREQLAELQEERLLRVVRLAYEHSPLYRWLWDSKGVHPDDIKSLDDFTKRIPFTSKALIKQWRDEKGDPFGGLLCTDIKRVNAIMSTSGTTGEPMFCAERHEPLSPLTAGTLRSLWEHGLRPGDYALAQPTTFRGGGSQMFRALGVTSIEFNSFLGGWSDVLDAIARYNIRFISLFGPLMGELERLGDDRDMRAALAPLKFASFAGEPLGSRMQAKVREEWDTALVMFTSAGDVGTAWQCTIGDGYHLWEDTAFVECCDPDSGQSLQDGEVGELVVTAIDDELAPLIRYRSDDLIRVSRGTCGCGRTHMRMWPLGRRGDRTLVQDKSVMPDEIWAIIERCDETRSALFQIIRPTECVDELRIRVGYDPDRTASLADLRDRLVERISESVGLTPTLELVDEAEILARASSFAKIPRVSKV